jgi:hypothetical protein
MRIGGTSPGVCGGVRGAVNASQGSRRALWLTALVLRGRESYNRPPVSRCPRPPRRLLALGLAGLLLGGACDTRVAPAPASAVTRPRLAIVLVVDQMRADYLMRYGDLYRGGLARFRREGAWFTQGHVQHALTYTAPGPRVGGHGDAPVAARHHRQRVVRSGAGKERISVEDPRVQPALTAADVSGKVAGRSPRSLQRPALGDWLKGHEPAARVFSVALKDRAAVLMGGKLPDRAYWYSPEMAGYVSSSWYADGAPLPAWVATFNASGAALARFVDGWTRARDSSAYLRSGPDRVDAEADGVHTEFPHTFDDGTPAARAAFAKGVLTTPFGDEMTLKFARVLIEAERLGADDVPDLLMISCSSADYIGHAYGPFSHEVEDYYLRLDGYLGELLTWLDEHVGKDSYVVALTADHGALPLPEEARLRGHHSAQRVVTSEYQAQARRAISGALTRLGLPAGTLKHLGEDGVWLDAKLAEAGKVDLGQLRAMWRWRCASSSSWPMLSPPTSWPSRPRGGRRVAAVPRALSAELLRVAQPGRAAALQAVEAGRRAEPRDQPWFAVLVRHARAGVVLRRGGAAGDARAAGGDRGRGADAGGAAGGEAAGGPGRSQPGFTGAGQVVDHAGWA